MKLYYSPFACSLAIHLILEEIGKPYELQAMNFVERDQFKPEFVALNPKSKVPTLVRDDGSVLTELPAIAFWLALTNPEKRLLPEDAEGQARALEAMDYLVATVHMRGFTRIFRPAVFSQAEAEHEAVRAQGREIAEQGLALMDRALAGKDYLLGDFSIADCVLFFITFWAIHRLKVTLPPNLERYWQAMMARPAVQRTLQSEGFK
jgi:glutathione S-transferase